MDVKNHRESIYGTKDASEVSWYQREATLSVEQRVRWITGDVLALGLPDHSIDVWHDRAVFHFLMSPEDRSRYVEQVRRVLRPNGHVIIATFAEDGPTRCSGLPVARYDATQLHAEFGDDFQLLSTIREEHVTPSGGHQQFRYCLCSFHPSLAIAAA